MRTFFLIIGLGLSVASASAGADRSQSNEAARAEAVLHYADVVHAAYVDAQGGAQRLQESVEKFCARPDEAGLQACRKAWERARQPYAVTEAFRFYGGPVDDASGPEGLMNAWPVDEAWLESGDGRGLIEDETTWPEITAEALRAANQKEGEKNIASGWHALEFLLWGKDESLEGPGQRPWTDFTSAPHAERRTAALRVLAQALGQDLEGLVQAWSPSVSGNYRSRFLQMETAEAARCMLTGLIYLSGQEMAGERLNVALETRDQEDEQSCFSDTTTQDLRHNLLGLQTVWAGTYESIFIAENDVSGEGLQKACHALDPAMADAVTAALNRCAQLAASLPEPFDRAIQNPDGSHERRMYQEMRAELEQLSNLFQAVADKMSLQIIAGGAFYNG
ncbi:putative iron-regulated protein [Prosthecobacter debontii]|uniref:Putative iron-regulated protein n=1 Tax=Prosthecobacter debontii TaxID=48467 RepID=A0A1T4YK67_9BACT|nr:imelysin family protein [Prosthecobacter debontii]SKB01651.1 putative iron-regulated protein [Prosthecobacter debontii]